MRAASVMSASSSASASPIVSGFAAASLRRQHVIDQRAAMQNALLLAPERVELREQYGRGCELHSLTETAELLVRDAGAHSVSEPTVTVSS